MKDTSLFSFDTKTLPHSPGVYIFKDENNNILYVGKAKDLKKRVSSYFADTKNIPQKTFSLRKTAKHLEYITVSSELEALLLETNYIKAHRPKYNILMKDDKNFVYITIEKESDFPKIDIVRKREKKNAWYFGPKTSKKTTEALLSLFKKIFLLRSCRLDIFETPSGIECKGHEKYPCIEYQMNRCSAPCIGKISSESYKKSLSYLIDFLRGHDENIRNELKRMMQEQASQQKFENAAKIRDMMFSLESFGAKQMIEQNKEVSQDIIGIYQEKTESFVCVFQIRAGKLINHTNIQLINSGEISEILESFLVSFYDLASDMPQEIILPQLLENQENIEEFFRIQYHTKIVFTTPKQGIKKDLLVLAEQNAKKEAENHLASFEKQKTKKEQIIKDLLPLFSPHSFPHRIEGYDISHFGGENTVASMVVFCDTKPKKSEYRHYTITKLKKGEINDYASLQEVISRRIMEIEYEIHKNTNTFSVEDFLCKEEKKGKNEIILSLSRKNTEKILFSITLIKHSAKLFEIIDFSLPCDTETEKFFHILFQILPKKFFEKHFWILDSHKDFFENIGFQKRKTLEKNWKKNPGLVPLEIVKTSRKKSGYALFLKPTQKPKPLPQMILIDGGKGQISAVHEVFLEHNWKYENSAFIKNNTKIIVCSLAKENEEIFFPGEKTPRPLKNTSEGSFFLQRIRDESHRFALDFQKKIREKEFFK
jgi:excinuclease ABC subunit C